ncbi:hypothetical protein [Salininema proteolyticum]|uniref:Uncharacterized protein n=1 Tax=Salininema proteolyticum TaxID=1607685 RepID=A0ABV8U5Z7_9ACTN
MCAELNDDPVPKRRKGSRRALVIFLTIFAIGALIFGAYELYQALGPGVHQYERNN